MTSRRSILLSLMLGAFLSVTCLQQANAVVPRNISYQGLLLDAAKKPVNATVSLTITIYNAVNVVLFTETHTNVVVVNGIFNVILGSTLPAGFPALTAEAIPQPFDFNQQYFLGVAIDGGAELSPHTPFVSAPYALNSQMVNGIEASTTPTPGKLLPLDANGRFPASVLPQSGFASINGIPLTPDSQLGIQAVTGSPITVATNPVTRTIEIGFAGNGGITRVDAGPGLTGGGTGPTVTLSVADQGITTRMLGSGVVTGIKIDQRVAGTGLVQDILGNLNVNVDSSLFADVVKDVIGINLFTQNKWIGQQTFNGGIIVNGTTGLNGPVNVTGGPLTIGSVLNPVTINHFGNTTHNGNVTITGTLTVLSPSTFNGIVNLGTLDQQSTIFNSSSNNGGAVTFNDPQGILNQQGGINNTGNIVSVGNLTNTGTLNQNGASTFNGTLTQLNGNAAIAGGTTNSFGTVAGSANTIGAAGSTNTFNGNDVFNVTGAGNMIINGLAEPNAVNAAAVLNYELQLNGDFKNFGATNLVGNVFLNQTLTVGGLTTTNGGLTNNGIFTQNGTSTFNGLSNFNGNINQILGSTTLLNTQINGTLGVSGLSTFSGVTNNGTFTQNGNFIQTSGTSSLQNTTITNLTVTGTSDLQGAISNTTANNGGAVTVNDPQGLTIQQGGINNTGTLTQNGNINQISGTTTLLGTTVNGPATVNGTFSVNGGNQSNFTGNIVQTLGAGISTSLSNTTITGTLTQSGGNVNIAGAATNTFGSFAGSNNTFGSVTSVNLINGVTNTLGTQAGVVNNIVGNLTGGQINFSYPATLPAIVANSGLRPGSKNELRGFNEMSGNGANTNENKFQVNGVPEVQAEDATPPFNGTPGVQQYEVVINGDVLITGHLASGSIPVLRTVRGTLNGAVTGGTVTIAVAGVTAVWNATATYYNDNGSPQGQLNAVAGAGTITVTSTAAADNNVIQVILMRP